MKRSILGRRSYRVAYDLPHVGGLPASRDRLSRFQARKVLRRVAARHPELDAYVMLYRHRRRH